MLVTRLGAACAAGERQWERPADDAPALSGPFVPSAAFVGARAGYAYKMGPKGLGYYLDAPSASGAAGAPQAPPRPAHLDFSLVNKAPWPGAGRVPRQKAGLNVGRWQPPWGCTAQSGCVPLTEWRPSGPAQSPAAAPRNWC